MRGDGTITEETARRGLKLFGVDERGLDKVDRAILDSICRQFHGGPVGLSTLAIAVGEQPETVEDMYEPFLIQQGMIARTARGRIAMPAAYGHLGLAAPAPPSAGRPVRLRQPPTGSVLRTQAPDAGTEPERRRAGLPPACRASVGPLGEVTPPSGCWR